MSTDIFLTDTFRLDATDENVSRKLVFPVELRADISWVAKDVVRDVANMDASAVPLVLVSVV